MVPLVAGGEPGGVRGESARLLIHWPGLAVDPLRDVMPREPRQFVRFLLLKLDSSWRRLSPVDQLAHKQEFAGAIHRFQARLLLRTYSLAGTRGDADLMLWQVADDLETFQALQTVLLSTRLRGYLSVSYSYLGMTRRSIYRFQ